MSIDNIIFTTLILALAIAKLLKIVGSPTHTRYANLASLSETKCKPHIKVISTYNKNCQDYVTQTKAKAAHKGNATTVMQLSRDACFFQNLLFNPYPGGVDASGIVICLSNARLPLAKALAHAPLARLVVVLVVVVVGFSLPLLRAFKINSI